MKKYLGLLILVVVIGCSPRTGDKDRAEIKELLIKQQAAKVEIEKLDAEIRSKIALQKQLAVVDRMFSDKALPVSPSNANTGGLEGKK